jgi:glutathione S-transferase
VRIALLEKDIPYELKEINLGTGEHKSVDFKKLQPFGVVPVIDDNGFLLYGMSLNPILI